MFTRVASFQFDEFRYAYEEHDRITLWRDTDQAEV